MEKNNSSKGVIALLIVIIIILGVLCVLFAMGTLNFKAVNTANIGNDKNADIQNANDAINNEKVENNTSTSSSNNGQLEKNSNFYDISDLKVQALEEYPIFNNISNNSNVVETIQEGTKYYADLYLTGQVNIRAYKNDKWIKGNLNVNNVIDIIDFSVPADETEQLLYLLTDKGDVYSYKFGEADNNSFNVTKIEKVSNVKKLFISHHSKQNAGGSWALFAITNDNECIMLKGESV